MSPEHRPRQPWLHDLRVIVDGPGLRWGGVPSSVSVSRDGEVEVTGVPQDVRISRGA